MKIRTALLIDDDSSIRSVTALTLKIVEGWQVTCAESCEEALQKLQDATPDVILLDVMMPGTDGVETLCILQEAGYADIPTIFMTAKALKHEIETYLKSGVAGVVPKPFEPKLLGGQIRNLLEGKSASARTAPRTMALA